MPQRSIMEENIKSQHGFYVGSPEETSTFDQLDSPPDGLPYLVYEGDFRFLQEQDNNDNADVLIDPLDLHHHASDALRGDTEGPEKPSALKSLLEDGERKYAVASPTSPSQFTRVTRKLASKMTKYHDFPSKGVLFEDIMPLFADPDLHHILIHCLKSLIVNYAFSSFPRTYKEYVASYAKVDVIVGLESRGFLCGPTLAYKMGAAFVPVRKKGKLPGPCESESYEKEYGKDEFEIQAGVIKPGQNVIIFDDIIATGGSAAAAARLVEKMGGHLIACVFLKEIPFLKGRMKLGHTRVLTLFHDENEEVYDDQAPEGAKY